MHFFLPLATGTGAREPGSGVPMWLFIPFAAVIVALVIWQRMKK